MSSFSEESVDEERRHSTRIEYTVQGFVHSTHEYMYGKRAETQRGTELAMRDTRARYMRKY